MTIHRIASADSCQIVRAAPRRCGLLAGAVVVVLLALAVGKFLNLGRWVAAGAVAPERADVLVAMGGDDGFRIRKVTALFAQGYAPRVLVTGLEGAPEAERRVYLDWRVQMLAGKGIPPDQMVLESSAKNSFEEAAATLALMRSRGWQTALIVSAPPHMRRLDWVWGRVFAGSGMRYRLVASEPEWWEADRWWRNEKSGQFVLTELIKLGYYLVKY